MNTPRTHAVTGAFGYSGKYIAERLLAKGRKVITLTNSLHRQNPFGEAVQAFPFYFDKPDQLSATLQGVEVLYNTYWVRFNHKMFTHADAVQNTLVLFNAAKAAGVERIVHVSITNPKRLLTEGWSKPSAASLERSGRWFRCRRHWDILPAGSSANSSTT